MMPQCPKPAIAAILAGGKAVRFGGQDKGEILIKGERLMDIIHRRLLPQSSEIIVSGMHDYNLDLPVVKDIEGAPGGPVGGLYSIWAHLKDRSVEGFFTAAVDGPNVPADLTAKLYNKDASAIAVDEQGLHPTYGWWRMKDLFALWEGLELKNSLSLKRLAELTNAEHVKWDGSDTFININCPDDLKTLVKCA